MEDSTLVCMYACVYVVLVYVCISHNIYTPYTHEDTDTVSCF